MMIQSTSDLFPAAAIGRLPLTGKPTSSANIAEWPENTADPISISKAGREALATSKAFSSPGAANTDKAVEARLAEIRAKGVVNRSKEDRDYLFANDKRLAEIIAQGKSSDRLTADELDYMQKATGFVNTFANLSPEEKALYDKAVAGGNTEAAAGISQIALIRMMGHTAGGSGTTYDPLNTEITPLNIMKYFRHSIVDPSGKTQSQFQALIQYLQDNPSV